MHYAFEHEVTPPGVKHGETMYSRISQLGIKKSLLYPPVPGQLPPGQFPTI